VVRTKRDLEDNTRLMAHPVQTFDPEGTYAWLIHASQRKLIFQSILLVIVGVVVCMIKVWPISVKIAIWWISLITLISMVGVIGLRLVLYSCLWVVGVRGVWLFPNLFDDDGSFFDAFLPLIARCVEDNGASGTSATKNQEKSKTANDSDVSKETEKSNATATDSNQSSNAKSSPSKPKTPSNRVCQFGWINFALLLVAGGAVCYYVGIFSPENVPNFVASEHDLWSNYPSLLLQAPPPQVNITLNRTAG